MSIAAGQAYKIASGCQDDSKDVLREQRQTTIAGVAVVEGFGYWGGKDVRVEFHPAEVNTGLVFIRDDLPTPAKFPRPSSTGLKRLDGPLWSVTVRWLR